MNSSAIRTGLTLRFNNPRSRYGKCGKCGAEMVRKGEPCPVCGKDSEGKRC